VAKIQENTQTRKGKIDIFSASVDICHINLGYFQSMNTDQRNHSFTGVCRFPFTQKFMLIACLVKVF